MRFAGTIEELCDADIRSMSAWIKAIPFEEWPQQSLTKLKPAMVTDLSWHGFGIYAWGVINELGFDETQAHNLMLSVVMPGESIPSHIDQQGPNWLFRVHAPLTTNPLAIFWCGGFPYRMEVGKAYKVNTLAEHAIENPGKSARVHFMFDVK